MPPFYSQPLSTSRFIELLVEYLGKPPWPAHRRDWNDSRLTSENRRNDDVREKMASRIGRVV